MNEIIDVEQSLRRLAFLTELTAALRPLGDPRDVQALASEMLGQHLGVNRVGYADIDGEGADAVAVVVQDWTDAAASIVGRHPLDQFGAAFAAEMRAGRLIRVADSTNDPMVHGDVAAAFAALGTRAAVTPTLVKDGRPVAVLFVHSASVRRWTDGEVDLVTQVAELTWAAVERARADAALYHSETRYRDLFEAIDAGFCIVEVDLNAAGGRTDYRVVEANPAFYRQTGFPEDVLGCWLRDAVPALEEHWYETYANVARTREPARFEQESAHLGRWFEVYAFPFGTDSTRHIGILFTDISGRRLAERQRELLTHELNHRIKNTLASVLAIFNQTMKGAVSMDEARVLFSDRISALGSAHDVLAAQNWSRSSLADIVEAALRPFLMKGAKIDVSGSAIVVSAIAATSFGLAVHELATNALKYGALSRPGGGITIRWGVDGDRFDFTWRETGGPPVSPPHRRGFGTKLIEGGLASAIGGVAEIAYEPQGVFFKASTATARLAEGVL